MTAELLEDRSQTRTPARGRAAQVRPSARRCAPAAPRTVRSRGASPLRTVAPHREAARPAGHRLAAWSRSGVRGGAGPRARGVRPEVTAVRLDGPLYWTRRGVAVMVALVAVTVGIMAATVVGAFWSVSDAPAPGVAPVVAAGAPGAALGSTR